MTTFCVQIQPHRAPGLSLTKVSDLGAAIAADKELVSRFGVVEGVDEVPYTNLMFDTAEPAFLWQRLQVYLYGNQEVRDGLLRCSMAMCEGEIGWGDYFLLFHYDKSQKLDHLE